MPPTLPVARHALPPPEAATNLRRRHAAAAAAAAAAALPPATPFPTTAIELPAVATRLCPGPGQPVPSGDATLCALYTVRLHTLAGQHLKIRLESSGIQYPWYIGTIFLIYARYIPTLVIHLVYYIPVILHSKYIPGKYLVYTRSTLFRLIGKYLLCTRHTPCNSCLYI